MLASLALVVGLALPTIGSGVAGVGAGPAGADSPPFSFAPHSDVSVGPYPRAVAVGDVNRDGHPDLVAANRGSDKVSVLLGSASGALGSKTDYDAGVQPSAVAVGDVNNDGYLDIVVGNDGVLAVSVLLGDGAGGFAPKTDLAMGQYARGVAIADLDGDGRNDLIVANNPGNKVTVARSLSSGGFSAPTSFAAGAASEAVAVGDFDENGKPDLAVANYSAGTVSVLLGLGGGSFADHVDYPSGSGANSIAVGDLNGDGHQDVVVANDTGNSVSTLMGDGSGTLAGHVDKDLGTRPLEVALKDLDGDGHLDVIVASHYLGVMTVLRGTNTATLGDRTDLPTVGWPSSAAAADFDGDGRQDIVTSNYQASSVSVLRNTTDRRPIAQAVTANVAHLVASTISLSGSDPDSDPITYAVATQPTKGTVSCTTAGACTYTSSPGQGGVDTFTYTVSDGTLTSDPATVTVNIANTAPTVTNRTMLAAWSVDAKITLTGTDADGDPLTYSVVTQPTKGTVDCTATGACTYVAAVGSSGTDTFTYRASDGIATSATRTVTVTIVDADAARARATLDGGTQHECATGIDGTVWCWGSDAFGQLGDGGTSTDAASPVQVSGLSTAVGAATGNQSSCALTNDGEVWCWGRDSAGQLGNGGGSTDVQAPTKVTGLSGAKALTVGATHACALTTAGEVWCWGADGSGQLGNGDPAADSQVPVQVSGLSGVVAIAARGQHTCAATSAGEVWCWGADTNGQLGNGGTSVNSTVPVKVSGLSNVVALAAGSNHSCAVTAAGAAWCWGADSNGQLGNGGSSVDTQVPVQVSGLSGAVGISARSDNSCAVTSAGTVWCWGSGTWGALGNGSTADAQAPVQVSGITDGVGVGIGSNHGCALRQTGAIKCWGYDAYGQLGNGTPLSDSSVPVTVSGGLTFRVDNAPKARLASVTAPRRTPTDFQLRGMSPTNSTMTYAVATPPTKGAVTCSTSGACTYTSNVGQTGSDSFTFTATDAAGTSDPTTATITLSNTAPVADAQTVGASVHIAKAISLTGSDGNGDALTYAIVGNPSKGSLSGLNASTGAVTYTSNVGATGTDTFTFKVNDGTADSATATVTINLSNTAPVADAQTLSAPKHQATAITLTGSDANGDPLTYSIVASPSKGALTGLNPSTGAVTYTSNVGATGTDTFTFRVNDGTVNSATATVTINLSNNVPVADAQAVTATKHIAKAITLTGSDPNGDSLTYAIVAGPSKGALTGFNASTGAVTYTSNVGATGTDTFTFKVNDGTSDSSTATVTITLANTAPVADAQTVSASVHVAKAITLTGSDANGDGITYAIVANPTKGSLTGFNASTGAVTYTSNLAMTGSDTFTFKVNDGTADSATATVTVNLVNDAPVAQPLAISAVKHVEKQFQLSGTDANGDGLTYTAGTASKGSVACDPSGACRYTSNVGATGTDTFTFKVNDGYVDSPSATVTISLTNTAPVADAQTVSASKHIAKAITLTGSDANSDPLTYAVVTNPTKGSLTGLNASTGAVTYTSNVGATGTDTFTFKVNDGTADSSTATVTINLTNTVPVADAQAVSASKHIAKAIALTGSDANGDGITYAIVANPSKGVLSGFNASTGAVTYTSNVGATGTDTFTFKVNDGTADSATATVTVTLTNTVPVADAQAVSASTHIAKAIALTGSDANGDGITYAIVANPSKGVLSGFNASTGAVTYTSNVGATGTDTFTFKVNDGTADSATATVTVTLTNTVPVADAQAVSASKHIAKAIVLTGSDANGDTLTYSIVGSPSKGALTGFNASMGAVTYTSNVGATGTDTFTFKVNDGTADSATAAVTITLTNDAPVADVQTVSAAKHIAKAITLTGSDPNGDAVTYAIATGPTKGTLTGFDAATGAVTYTSNVGVTGTDSFTFTVSDGTSTSAPATVNVNFTNDLPVAQPLAISAQRLVEKQFQLSGTDPNGDGLTYSAGVASKGTLTCDPSGWCSYTSNVGATGTDSFTFTVDDGTATSLPATVTIDLTNTAPTAAGQSLSSQRHQTTAIDLVGSDANQDPLTYRVVGQPAKGTVSCTSAGACSYTSAVGATGTDSFTFVANDGIEDSAPATVSITLANTPPAVTDRSTTAVRWAPTDIALTGTDANDDALAFRVVSAPSHGTVSCTTDGRCVYLSDASGASSDSFGYVANDGLADSAARTVTVSVARGGSGGLGYGSGVDGSTGTDPLAVATGDLNGDGKPDVAVANYGSESVSVYLGTGTATLGSPTSYPTGGGAHGVTIADVNGDGAKDLIVANATTNSVAILIGNGSGTFGAASTFGSGGSYPEQVAVGDFNEDGKVDLAIANYQSSTVGILLGSGTGSFTASAALAATTPDSVAVGDFDEDGHQDLVVANHGTSTVTVRRGNGLSAFGAPTTYATGTTPISAVVTDVDGDHHQDVVVAAFGADVVSVLRGTGTGTFDPRSDFPTAGAPISVAAGDQDGNGTVDLAVANSGSGTISVLLGSGSGGFAQKVDVPAGSWPYGVATADLNVDGRLDLVSIDRSSASVRVRLNTTNRAPSASASSVQVPRRVATSFDLSASDPDGDALAYAVGAPPTKGSLSCTTAGHCSYTSDVGATGTDSFTFTVNDGTVDSPAATVSVNLTNTAPVADAQSTSAAVHVAKAISLTGSDANGDSLTYAIVSSPTKGALSGFNASTGAVTYTSNVGATGTDTFTFKVNDGTSDSAPATVTINLTNTAPVADVQAVSAARHVAKAITLTGSDANGDTVTYSIVGGPTKGSLTGLNASTGAVTYTSNVGATGTDTFTFKVNDGKVDSSTAAVTVTITNTAPTSSAQTVSAPKHVATPITLTGNDANGDALTYSIVGSPSKGSLTGLNASTGAVTYTSNVGATGTDTFTFKVNDGTADSSTATVTVNLTNTAPVANVVAVGARVHVARTVQLAGSDANGDAITYSIVGGPSKGSLSGLDAVNGTVTYTSNVGATGSDTFTYKVDDGTTSSASAAVTVWLDEPFLAFGTHRDASVGTNPRGIAAGDFNRDGRADLVTANRSSGSISVLLGSGTGSFSSRTDYTAGFQPSALVVGDVNRDGYQDIVTANDGPGTASVFLGTSTGTFGSPTTVSFGAGLTSVALGDVNGDGRTDLVGTGSYYPSGAAVVVLGQSGGGWSAPSFNAVGATPYDVKVGDFDEDGKQDLAVANYGTGNVSVLRGLGNGSFAAHVDYVTGSGAASLAVGDVNEDGHQDLVVANDTGSTVSILVGSGTGTFSARPDVAPGARPLTVALADLDGDGHLDLVTADHYADRLSVLRGSGTGSVSGQVDLLGAPAPAAVTTVDLDGDGRRDIATTDYWSNMVSVFLSTANRRPTATARSLSVDRGASKAFTLTGTDADGDPLVVEVASQPTKGTLSCDGAGSCTYAATPGASGSDSFTFTVNDGVLDSAPATVSIDLIDHAPVAESRSLTAVRLAATPFTVHATDVDGDTLAYAVSTPPTKGTASCDVDGSCTYTSSLGATGTDSFTFAVSDGLGGVDTGTVSVTLTNTAPHATAQSVTVHRRIASPITLAGTDANGDALEYSVSTAPAKGTLSCEGAACTYTSDASATGSDSFGFSVDDGQGGTDTATVSLTLVNDAPIADPQALPAGVHVATPVTLTATDANSDPLHYEVVGQPTKGTVSCGDDGACTYRSNSGATGTDSFRFRASDGFGGSDEAVVELSLSNTKPVAEPQVVAAPRQVGTLIALAGSDPNGDDLTYAVTTPPTKGTVSCVGASCVYTSAAGASGSDAFTFSVDDGKGGTDTAVVTIDLVNSAPSASPASYTVTKGIAKAFHLAGSDPNGDPVAFQVVAPPTKGTVTCTGTDGGSCTYVATEAIGLDTFQVVATDGHGGTSDPVTITLHIELPKVAIGDVTVLEPQTGSIGAFVPLSLGAPLPTDVTVRYYTVDGTATGGRGTNDYQIFGSATAPQSIRIPAGQTWTAIGVPVYGDTNVEGDETFSVVVASITAADGSVISARSTVGDVTILDSGPASASPILNVVSTASYEGDAGRTPSGFTRAQVMLQFSKATTQAMRLTYKTIDGTATGGPEGVPGADYKWITNGVIDIPAGTTGSKVIDVLIQGDTVTEDDETFQLLVVTPSGAPIVVRNAVATATILNDD